MEAFGCHVDVTFRFTKTKSITRPEVSSYPPQNVAMLHCMSVDNNNGLACCSWRYSSTDS